MLILRGKSLDEFSNERSFISIPVAGLLFGVAIFDDDNLGMYPTRRTNVLKSHIR